MAGRPAVGPVPTLPSEEAGLGPPTRAAPTGQLVPGPSKGRGFVVGLGPAFGPATKVATGVTVHLTGKILVRGIGGGRIILITLSSNAAKCHILGSMHPTKRTVIVAMKTFTHRTCLASRQATKLLRRHQP